jgi:hypothetical protein
MDNTRGNLAHHRLSFLMPALFEGQPPTGALTVSRGSVRRTFWVSQGFLVAESSNVPREHLGQVLVDLRVLPAAKAAAAFEASERERRPFGTFLLERSFLDRPRLLEALEHKAREAIFDSYRWEAGDFEFCPGEVPASGQIALGVRLGTLHRDALARAREWASFHDVFPDPATRFHVFHHFAADWSSPEDDALLLLAERGAAVAELIASGGESGLSNARRLLRLYRRGALAPRTGGPKVGEAIRAHELLARAFANYARGEFETAAALATEALDQAPLPEAHALFREAELRIALSVSDRLVDLEGRLTFQPLPRELPASLTTDDLYVYSRLKSARSLREAIRTAPMGELAAFRALEHLMRTGIVLERRRGGGFHDTIPFGIRLTQA